MLVYVDEKHVFVACNFDEKEMVKSVGNYQYLKKRNLWRFPLSSLLPIVENLNIDYDKHTKKIYEELKIKDNKYKETVSLTNQIKKDDSVLENMPGMKALYKHQKKAVTIASMFDSYALFMDVGTGKSAAAIRLLLYKRVPTMIVAPLSILESVWVKELEKWGQVFGKNAGLKVVNLWNNLKEFDNNYDVYVINYEQFKKLENIEAKIQYLIVDECFTGNTLVDTIQGTKEIQDVKKGDIVYNCLGESVVLNNHKRYIKQDDFLVLTTIQGIDIISSKKHLFFTQRGWVEAYKLTGEDYVIHTYNAMRMVQEGINIQTDKNSLKKQTKMSKRETFLWEILLGEMENDTTGNKEKNTQRNNIPKNKCQAKNIFELKSPCCNSKKRTNTIIEANVESINKEKSINNIKKNRAQTSNSRRQWEAKSLSSGITLQYPQRKNASYMLETKSRNQLRQKDKKISNKLQSRYSQFNSNDSDRSRRLLSFSDRKTNARQKENFKIVGVKVESIKIYKSIDTIFNKHRDKRGRVVLYDLEIKGHPSFSIYGLTVHNSSKLKNPFSGISKKILEYRSKIKYRLILSGKPAPNNLMEFWSQMAFINNDLLGSNFYAFRNKYFFSSGYGGYLYQPFSGAREKIMHQVDKQAFFIQKEDCLDLPDKTFNVRSVFMDSLQQKKYDDMRKENIMEFKDRITLGANELSKIMKLRQITAGFTITTSGMPLELSNSKTKELLAVLDELDEDRQVIIWIQFHYEIEMIKKALKDNYATLYGDMKQKDKEEAISDFQNNKVRYLIAHPLSGSFGLTFINSSYVIWFSLSYSFEQYYQANNRIHRIGQQNKCTYILLLAKNSIDEVIYKALKKKENITLACLNMLKGK